MILDVVEVAKVTFFNARFTARSMYQLNDLQSHTGLNLAVAFAKILKDFGIADRVLVNMSLFLTLNTHKLSSDSLDYMRLTHQTMM